MVDTGNQVQRIQIDQDPRKIENILQKIGLIVHPQVIAREKVESIIPISTKLKMIKEGLDLFREVFHLTQIASVMEIKLNDFLNLGHLDQLIHHEPQDRGLNHKTKSKARAITSLSIRRESKKI